MHFPICKVILLDEVYYIFNFSYGNMPADIIHNNKTIGKHSTRYCLNHKIIERLKCELLILVYVSQKIENVSF